MLVAEIQERFLSAQADAFTGSEREEKASARFVRNDSLVLRAKPYDLAASMALRSVVSGLSFDSH